MVTRFSGAVNARTEDGFQLLRACVQVALAIGAGLRRELDHGNVGTNVLGKPIAVNAQVMVRDTGTNPTAPIQLLDFTHRVPKGIKQSLCDTRETRTL